MIMSHMVVLGETHRVVSAHIKALAKHMTLSKLSCDVFEIW